MCVCENFSVVAVGVSLNRPAMNVHSFLSDMSGTGDCRPAQSSNAVNAPSSTRTSYFWKETSGAVMVISALSFPSRRVSDL